VEGDRLIDGSGRQVILRGANAGMRSKLPPFYPFEPEPDFDIALDKYADAFEDLGFNAVRLLIIWEAAEPERGVYDEDYLALYDKMVEAFGRRGIRVIVDSHQDIVSRRFCGDGFPDWAIAERYRDLPQHADCGLWELNNLKYSVASSWDRFWTNKDGIQDRYVEMFGMLAGRYCDNPAVIGFEPINEPVPGLKGTLTYSTWNEERLYVMYERVGEAVHSVDKRFLVFADNCPFENLGSWSESRRRPNIDNLVFAPHYYDTGYVKFEWTTGRDREVMQNGLEKHIALGRRWDVPILVGEYGIEMGRGDAPAYVNNLYSVFDELQLSGTIWEASMSPTLWNGRDKNIFNPDGSTRPGARALDRPYPMAVAGVIETFSYDHESGRFELIFLHVPDIEAPTAIYLPERVYGTSPRVITEPEAQHTIDARRRILKVDHGAAGRKTRIVVDP
jgi:endoglycosylceramidase